MYWNVFRENKDFIQSSSTKLKNSDQCCLSLLPQEISMLKASCWFSEKRSGFFPMYEIRYSVVVWPTRVYVQNHKEYSYCDHRCLMRHTKFMLCEPHANKLYSSSRVTSLHQTKWQRTRGPTSQSSTNESCTIWISRLLTIMVNTRELDMELVDGFILWIRISISVYLKLKTLISKLFGSSIIVRSYLYFWDFLVYCAITKTCKTSISNLFLTYLLPDGA